MGADGCCGSRGPEEHEESRPEEEHEGEPEQEVAVEKQLGHGILEAAAEYSQWNEQQCGPFGTDNEYGTR